MSPDWSAKEEPVPYATMDDPQSLNLYSYVKNNPLSHVDADGHCCDVKDIFVAVVTGVGTFAGAQLGSAAGGVGGTFVEPGGGTAVGFVGGGLLGGVTGGTIANKLANAIVNVVSSSNSSSEPAPAPSPQQVPTKAPGFVGDAGGNVVKIPEGSTARPSDNGKGTVYQPPVADGQHPDANAVRVMGPQTKTPNGSITVHGRSGQPINPATGKPDTRANTHTEIVPSKPTGQQ